MPRSSHSSRFYHPKNICWRIQIIKFIITQFSSFPCHLVPLRPKETSLNQHSISRTLPAWHQDENHSERESDVESPLMLRQSTIRLRNNTSYHPPPSRHSVSLHRKMYFECSSCCFFSSGIWITMTLLPFPTLLTLRSWLGYKYSSFMLRMKYYTDFEEMRSPDAPSH